MRRTIARGARSRRLQHRPRSPQTVTSRLRHLIVAGLVCIAGCATSADQLRDADLDWGGVTVQRGYQDVYRDIRAGLMQCNTTVAAKGDIDAANQRAKIGLYRAGGALAIGIVKITQVGTDATTVAAGVINPIDEPAFGTPGTLREGIVRYARGEIVCE